MIITIYYHLRADFLKSRIKQNKIIINLKASKKIRLNFTLKEMRLVNTNKNRWYHG